MKITALILEDIINTIEKEDKVIELCYVPKGAIIRGIDSIVNGFFIDIDYSGVSEEDMLKERL